MVDLKAIRVFLEVAAELSFAKAARSLKMTPASITRIVSNLESDMGLQLFVRTTRQVSLTTAGALALARYKPLVQAFDLANDELTGASRADSGRLRINAPMSMGIRVLPSLIESFRLAYPRIELEVFLTDTLMDIIEGDCDMAIRISGPPTDKSTIWRKICQIPRYAVAAPALFERLPAPADPEDLDRDSLMAYSSDGRPEVWKFTKAGQKREVKTTARLISNNGDYLCSAAIAGGGVCVLPEFIVRDGLAAGALEKVLPNWSVEHLWLTLYYPPYERLPPLVATFSEFFESYMRGQDGTIFEASRRQ